MRADIVRARVQAQRREAVHHREIGAGHEGVLGRGDHDAFHRRRFNLGDQRFQIIDHVFREDIERPPRHGESSDTDAIGVKREHDVFHGRGSSG